MNVKIEKRDGEYAAVTEGALGRNDKIIIDSNKTIEDGDRVAWRLNDKVFKAHS